MQDLKFTVLKRKTEWDVPEVNMLSSLIRGLIYRYDKNPGIIVAPGEYSRESVVDTLGYGNFEHMIVSDIADLPQSLEPEIRKAMAELNTGKA